VRSADYRAGVPDPIFAHPRLAVLYDAFDGPRDDLNPYLAICEELGSRSVADIGCGTGSLAVRLASRGIAVVAVDPAAASLEVARTKPGAERVTWIHGEARDLPAGEADLATMTGNVAQVFVTDDAWRDVLHAVHAGLRPHGFLVFETRRPGRRVWEEWAAGPQTSTRTLRDVGDVEETFEVLRVDLPLVSVRHTYRFAKDGDVLSSVSTLRFRSESEVGRDLVEAGFQIHSVRDAPDRPGDELVFIAQRAS
jgi:SAM-dependent methyltransferase